MANATFLDWALWYAKERNWAVFPVKPLAKAPPLVEHGLKDASRDPVQITTWWTKYPTANIAVRTGDECFVTDQDPGGEETWDSLILEHGRPPDTLTAITPRGGLHRFWQPVEGASMASRAPARDDWKGIDVRGDGGYVLVHPSIVLVGGMPRRYEWDGLDGEAAEIVAAPRWLTEALLSPHPNGQPKPPFELPPVLRATDKQRHPFLFRYGAKLRGDGLGHAEIEAALLSVNRARCEPPYDEEHVLRLAHDIVNRYPAGRAPQDAPPPGPAHAPWPTVQTFSPPRRVKGGDVRELAVDPPEVLIEGVLPRRGLALFTGAQKMGKTILGAQASVAIAMGHALLGYYQVEKQGPVMIVETDDPAGDSSFKDLWNKWDVPASAPTWLYFTSPVLGAEFQGWIESEIKELSPRLVMLDSYLSLRPARGKGDVVYTEKQEIAELDALGKRLNTLILLLHHESSTTKANSLLGWDARGAGTYAVTAAAESQLSISRFFEMDSSPVRLVQARGRHMAERQMAIAYDENLGSFVHLVDGPAALHYPLIREMRRAIQTPVFSSGDLIEATGVSRPTAFRHLATLVNAGAVVRDKSNEYRFTPDILRMPV